MNLIRLGIRAESESIPLVESAVRQYGKRYGLDDDDIDRFMVTVEESLSQVIEHGYPGRPDEMFDVDIATDGLDLIVTVTDKGVPYDYDSLERTGDGGISVRLLKGFADGASLICMGAEGRKQVLKKHLTSVPDFQRSVPCLRGSEGAGEYGPDDFDCHPLRREEAIEVAQCIYDEFGYTYPHEMVYHPDGFFKATEQGNCISFVATAPNGEVAGHVALVGTPSLHGTMELCMGIVRRKYRKCSIMNKLTDMMMAKAREIGLASVNAMPVIYHVFTQKVCNKQGMGPYGFSFNRLNEDLSTSYDQGLRGSLGWAGITLRDTRRTIYVRPEASAIAEYVVSAGGLDRSIVTVPEDVLLEGSTEISTETDARMNFVRIVVDRTGEDIRNRVAGMERFLRDQRCEVVEILISVNDERSVRAYDEAVRLGFFCTGLFAGCEDRDYLMMERTMHSSIDFDKIETIEPFTGLMELVKEGIADE